MANPYASQCHTSARDKMGSVSGSPKNFESPYDKGQRFVGPDGASAPVPKKFADGGGVTTASGATVKSGMQRNPNASISPSGKVSGMKSGGAVHSDEKEDRKLFNKMFEEKGEK